MPTETDVISSMITYNRSQFSWFKHVQFRCCFCFYAETPWEFPRRFDGAAAVLLFSIEPPYYQHSHGTCGEAQLDIWTMNKWVVFKKPLGWFLFGLIVTIRYIGDYHDPIWEVLTSHGIQLITYCWWAGDLSNRTGDFYGYLVWVCLTGGF